MATEGPSGIWLFTGQGNGLLNPAVLIPVNDATVNGLFALDVNGDGKLDFVAATATGFAVFLGNGTFLAGKEVNLGVASSSVALGDLTGNGFLDIVTAVGEVAYGNGKGQFSAPKSYGDGISGIYVTTANLTNNGRADVLILASNYASVLISAKSGPEEGDSVPVS